MVLHQIASAVSRKSSGKVILSFHTQRERGRARSRSLLATPSLSDDERIAILGETAAKLSRLQ